MMEKERLCDFGMEAGWDDDENAVGFYRMLCFLRFLWKELR